MKKLFLFFILNSLFLIPAVEPAHAQSVDLGIYPPVFEFNVTPPADVKVPFFIQNYSDTSVDLSLSLKPFTASDSENGQVSYVDDISSFPDPFLFNRIQVLDNDIPINSLTLSPGQKRFDFICTDSKQRT